MKLDLQFSEGFPGHASVNITPDSFFILRMHVLEMTEESCNKTLELLRSEKSAWADEMSFIERKKDWITLRPQSHPFAAPWAPIFMQREDYEQLVRFVLSFLSSKQEHTYSLEIHDCSISDTVAQKRHEEEQEKAKEKNAHLKSVKDFYQYLYPEKDCEVFALMD